jgi:hypothetical protein
MFITYYWVDNWLKLMAACAEQMQPLAAEGDVRTALEAELEQLRGALAESEAAMNAAIRERGELQAELERRRLQAEADRTEQARQLTDSTAAAEKRLGEETARRAAAQAETEALQRKLAATEAEVQQARAQVQRWREELETLRGENERLAAEVKAHKANVESLRSELGELRGKLKAAPASAADARQPADSNRPPAQEPPSGEVRKAPKRSRKPAGTRESPAGPSGLVLRLCKPAGWSEPVHVYYWNTDPAVAEPAWPGPSMSDEGDGWWAHRIEGARAADMIFSDAAGHQTGNLHRKGSGSLGADGAWVDDG